MSGRSVPSQLDQVLPRFSVQKPGPYHPFGRIRIAPFGKGVLRILGESTYTFMGFPNLAPGDGPSDSTIQKGPGGLSSASFLEEFLDLLDLHNQDAVLPVGRGTIIQGDICKTFPQWLEQNPEARFCLCNLDMDIYEPTVVVLEACWDRIVPGGVLILDEYATSKWPGETKAWDDFAANRGLSISLKRFSYANAPGAYLIKP